jgi:L-seryl-tRNA(Ser) seleniumtransferase
VGIADRFSGAGVRDTEAWEIGAAIDEKTAAVCYVAYAHSLPLLPEVVEVAHAAGVPVIVDAAGQLPPAGNLQRFVADGADLVAFSGGKAIGGPQSSGILCGRRDLIAAAALQNLDLDVLPQLWRPPVGLIDRHQLPGAPQHGIGRPCKVGKEEIVGLLTALELFVAEAPEARRQRWLQRLEELVAASRGVRHAALAIVADRKRPEIPVVHLSLDEEAAGFSALDLVAKLQDGDPPIHANPGQAREGVVAFGPTCLKEGEPAIIGRHLRALLGAV